MYLKIKRLIDIVLSIFLLFMLLPFFIIISMILMFMGMNPIYKQKRSGKNNKEFIIYKFRTIDKNKNIPSFCAFLRTTGIDELLQLFNILKGDMSFIGPRPWLTEYSKHFNKEQLKRLNVLPGLTGLAQIHEHKNIFDKIEKDLEYVDNISFKLDLFIFFNTIKMIITGKKKSFTPDDINQEIMMLTEQSYSEI